MVDKRPQTPKGLRDRVKDVFKLGSSSRSNLRTPIAAPASTVSAITIDPEEAAKLRAKYTHFRILVIGRANAGKTTLLKRVCNTTEDPVYGELQPTDERGIHDVRHPFSFKSNPQFIFHDSPGFEAGGDEELQEVQTFIQEMAKSKEVHDQIHVIWFCFTLNASRPLLELEKRFFNEPRAGNVPVVAIFTKFDDLIVQVYDEEKDKEANRELACATLRKKFEQPLKAHKFPPCAYVRFESIHKDKGNHQEQVGELISQTAASIDNLALKMLFITVQQNNLEICIKYAVNNINFEHISHMYTLIWVAASWFGHCYKTHDYGKDEERETYTYYYTEEGAAEAIGYEYGAEGEAFTKQIQPIVCKEYKRPSLYALAAILICLEHSFWLTKKVATAADTFETAWASYFPAHQVKVHQELKQCLDLHGLVDWCQGQRNPSQEVRTKIIETILENRL